MSGPFPFRPYRWRVAGWGALSRREVRRRERALIWSQVQRDAPELARFLQRARGQFGAAVVGIITITVDTPQEKTDE